MFFLVKVIISGIVISVVSWLAAKKSILAGFLTALPLTTLLALLFNYVEFKETEQSVAYAKSIFVAIPMSLLFFIPFLLATKLQLNFWSCYISGIVLLGVGYIAHGQLMKFF